MTVVRPDGSFEFQRVLPGNYIIRSQVLRINNDPGPVTPVYSYYAVTVSNASIDNLEVPLIAGGELTGKITIEGRDQQQQQRNDASQSAAAGGSQAPTPRPSVMILPAQIGPVGNTANSQSNDDGTFRMKNVGPDKYQVNVTGLPPGTYVKSIQYGGQDVTKSTLDMTSGVGGPLNIILSPEAADVSGIARNSKGEVMGAVMVTLWERGTPNDLPGTILNRTAVTDQNGNFQFRNLPPGEYRVAGWELSDSNVQDPNFRAKFEGQAATVKLAASAHATTDAPVIPQEAIEVEAAKLR
jgi:uncharacterized protein (DUF2141 family)